MSEARVGTEQVRGRSLLKGRARLRLLAVAYIAVVAVLAASAFSNPHGSFGWQEGAAMLLTLPAMLPALPVLYVLGAAAWNATGAGDGGPMWPVTLAYTVMFASIAAANVWLLSSMLQRTKSKRAAPPL